MPALPRELGTAKDGNVIIASSGPFGPYLKAGKYNIQIKDYDPYTIDFATANKLYQAKLDSIVADWGDVMIIIGAYGPYVKGPGRFNNVKIPKETDPKSITLEQAQKMLEEKSKSGRTGRFGRKTSSKSSAKATKSTPKTTVRKKSTAKTAKPAKTTRKYTSNRAKSTTRKTTAKTSTTRKRTTK